MSRLLFHIVREINDYSIYKTVLNFFRNKTLMSSIDIKS